MKSNQELQVILICWSEELRSRSGVAQAGMQEAARGIQEAASIFPPPLFTTDFRRLHRLTQPPIVHSLCQDSCSHVTEKRMEAWPGEGSGW